MCFRKRVGALLDNLSKLYLATLSEIKTTDPMRRAADPIVVTKCIKIGDAGTLSTRPISIAADAATLTTEATTSGADATVQTD